MRKVVLTLKEQEKYTVIKKLVETDGNKLRAARKLRISTRQVNRLISGYKEFGKEFFVHGNRGRKPAHALSLEQKNHIEDLYVTKYFDCTYTIFTELLAKNENIFLSVAEVGQILRERYIISPKTKRITRKILRNYYCNRRSKQTPKRKLLKSNLTLLQLKMSILGNHDVYTLAKRFK